MNERSEQQPEFIVLDDDPAPVALPDDGVDLPTDPLPADDALAREVWCLAQALGFPPVALDMGAWAGPGRVRWREFLIADWVHKCAPDDRYGVPYQWCHLKNVASRLHRMMGPAVPRPQ